MIIKASQEQSYCLIEILADNGNPASPQNPIGDSEFAQAEKPNVSGKLAVLSGMPVADLCGLMAHYKNLFQAIAIASPKEGVAKVRHSTTPEYPLGMNLPLA